MSIYLKIGVVMVIGASILFANGSVSKNDEHSVKKNIESFSKTEEKNIDMVDKFKKMFTEGKVSGEIRTMYAGFDYKKSGSKDTYSTAIGGELKYELAEFKGFNAGVAFNTSQDISSLSGDKAKFKNNAELSSSSGDYTQLTEAYINYKYAGLNLRAGRQVIDTPLADSDDIRMIKDTFEAYIATYQYNNFTFTGGNLQRWQGFDTGLDNGYSNETGKDGTWMAGVIYGDEIVDVNTWYYNISKMINAFYVDIDFHYKIDEDLFFHIGAQYLDEQELDNSGVEANIYGFMSEVNFYDLTLGVAYNKSNKQTSKDTFSGFGGGTLYTSMDTHILNDITSDRDATAIVVSGGYSFEDFNFLYAWGNFVGDKDSVGVKEDIIEQDIGIEYTLNDNFSASAFYIISNDEQNSAKTDNDWNRVQVTLNYNF